MGTKHVADAESQGSGSWLNEMEYAQMKPAYEEKPDYYKKRKGNKEAGSGRRQPDGIHGFLVWCLLTWQQANSGRHTF